MSELNREAIEATKALWPEFEQEAKNLFKCVQNNFGWMPIAESLAQAYAQGRTAALPHLAPQPRQSDEERAEKIARGFTPVDMGGTIRARTSRILDLVAAVRAEATLAEREACAKMADNEKVDADATNDECDEAYNMACDHIAAALRGRKP